MIFCISAVSVVISPFSFLILLIWILSLFFLQSQIQCNPHQITNGIFHRIRIKNFTICMETQKTLNSQSNLEKEKWSWRNQAPRLQSILQSYSNQDSMVLAQKQNYRSMVQDRKPRDKPTHIWSPNLWQRRQEYTMEKRQSLQ